MQICTLFSVAHCYYYTALYCTLLYCTAGLLKRTAPPVESLYLGYCDQLGDVGLTQVLQCDAIKWEHFFADM